MDPTQARPSAARPLLVTHADLVALAPIGLGACLSIGLGAHPRVGLGPRLPIRLGPHPLLSHRHLVTEPLPIDVDPRIAIVLVLARRFLLAGAPIGLGPRLPLTLTLTLAIALVPRPLLLARLPLALVAGPLLVPRPPRVLVPRPLCATARQSLSHTNGMFSPFHRSELHRHTIAKQYSQPLEYVSQADDSEAILSTFGKK